MYQIAAQVALSMYTSGLAAKARLQEEQANAIAQADRRRLQFNRDQAAFLQNVNAAKRQETSEQFNIGLAAAEAEDNLKLVQAGSGLSGASINELDDEISRQVGADRIASHRNEIQTLDQLNQQRIGNNENRSIETNMARQITNPKNDIRNAAFAAGGQAIGSLDPKLFDTANFEKPGAQQPINQPVAFNSRNYYSGSTRIG